MDEWAQRLLDILLVLLVAWALVLMGVTPVAVVKRLVYWWDWFRWRTFDTPIGYYINSQGYRRLPLAFKWRADKKPIEREIRDEEENTATIWVVRFSERDIRARQKFLSEPVSTEEGRRGRSARGQNTSIQIQRLRQFNFERGLKDWTFVYPDEVWSEEQGEYVPEPKAGQPVPVNRQEIENMDARISEQIDDILSEINEPPAELPELRDEEGNVIEEARESPLVANSAAR